MTTYNDVLSWIKNEDDLNTLYTLADYQTAEAIKKEFYIEDAANISDDQFLDLRAAARKRISAQLYTQFETAIAKNIQNFAPLAKVTGSNTEVAKEIRKILSQKFPKLDLKDHVDNENRLTDEDANKIKTFVKNNIEQNTPKKPQNPKITPKEITASKKLTQAINNDLGKFTSENLETLFFAASEALHTAESDVFSPDKFQTELAKFSTGKKILENNKGVNLTQDDITDLLSSIENKRELKHKLESIVNQLPEVSSEPLIEMRTLAEKIVKNGPKKFIPGNFEKELEKKGHDIVLPLFSYEEISSLNEEIKIQLAARETKNQEEIKMQIAARETKNQLVHVAKTLSNDLRKLDREALEKLKLSSVASDPKQFLEDIKKLVETNKTLGNLREKNITFPVDKLQALTSKLIDRRLLILEINNEVSKLPPEQIKILREAANQAIIDKNASNFDKKLDEIFGNIFTKNLLTVSDIKRIEALEPTIEETIKALPIPGGSKLAELIDNNPEIAKRIPNKMPGKTTEEKKENFLTIAENLVNATTKYAVERGLDQLGLPKSDKAVREILEDNRERILSVIPTKTFMKDEHVEHAAQVELNFRKDKKTSKFDKYERYLHQALSIVKTAEHSLSPSLDPNFSDLKRMDEVVTKIQLDLSQYKKYLEDYKNHLQTNRLSGDDRRDMLTKDEATIAGKIQKIDARINDINERLATANEIKPTLNHFLSGGRHIPSEIVYGTSSSKEAYVENNIEDAVKRANEIIGNKTDDENAPALKIEKAAGRMEERVNRVETLKTLSIDSTIIVCPMLNDNAATIVANDPDAGGVRADFYLNKTAMETFKNEKKITGKFGIFGTDIPGPKTMDWARENIELKFIPKMIKTSKSPVVEIDLGTPPMPDVCVKALMIVWASKNVKCIPPQGFKEVTKAEKALYADYSKEKAAREEKPEIRDRDAKGQEQLAEKLERPRITR